MKEENFGHLATFWFSIFTVSFHTTMSYCYVVIKAHKFIVIERFFIIINYIVCLHYPCIGLGSTDSMIDIKLKQVCWLKFVWNPKFNQAGLAYLSYNLIWIILLLLSMVVNFPSSFVSSWPTRALRSLSPSSTCMQDWMLKLHFQYVSCYLQTRVLNWAQLIILLQSKSNYS